GARTTGRAAPAPRDRRAVRAPAAWPGSRSRTRPAARRRGAPAAWRWPAGAGLVLARRCPLPDCDAPGRQTVAAAPHRPGRPYTPATAALAEYKGRGSMGATGFLAAVLLVAGVIVLF